jgi:sugar lactone lactonase YvrE
MKDFSVRGLILLVLFLASGTQAQFFNGPESVTYDELNGRYLISNVLTGDIVQISDAGDTTFFDRSLTRTLGMTIVDSILYVADINGIATYDLTTDQQGATITIPGMHELNDLTADTSGYLYITDVAAGKIFRVRISDHFDTTIVSGIIKPNGILFDAQNNRVLFCQFVPNAPIKEIDLEDLSVNSVLSTTFANFDGLAFDGNGYIYVSCWGTNAVYRYDNTFSQPAELVSNGHSGPADIFYNQLDNILAVPNYYSNRVNFIPITPVDVDEVYGRMPLAVALLQNFPNPFNPSTTIRYKLPEGSKVSLKIYNLLGKEIVELVNEFQPAGLNTSKWDGKDKNGYSVCSGIYLYSLISKNFSHTKKMLLIK